MAATLEKPASAAPNAEYVSNLLAANLCFVGNVTCDDHNYPGSALTNLLRPEFEKLERIIQDNGAPKDAAEEIVASVHMFVAHAADFMVNAAHCSLTAPPSEAIEGIRALVGDLRTDLVHVLERIPKEISNCRGEA
jgi:hypothetical protein